MLGFVGHAVAEPLIGDACKLSSVLPVALVGLLAQLPFALVVVSLACHVLSLAERLARVVAATSGARVRVSTTSYPAPRATNATAFRLDLAYAERGSSSRRLSRQSGTAPPGVVPARRGGSHGPGRRAGLADNSGDCTRV